MPNELMPLPKTPACPTWLDAEGKREWKRITALLEPYGVLTELDRSALAIYGSLWSHFWECEKTARGPDATEAKKPLAHAAKLGALIKQYLAMLGLDPADRGG